jgi:hypothetical protein
VIRHMGFIARSNKESKPRGLSDCNPFQIK